MRRSLDAPPPADDVEAATLPGYGYQRPGGARSVRVCIRLTVDESADVRRRCVADGVELVELARRLLLAYARGKSRRGA